MNDTVTMEDIDNEMDSIGIDRYIQMSERERQEFIIQVGELIVGAAAINGVDIGESVINLLLASKRFMAGLCGSDSVTRAHRRIGVYPLSTSEREAILGHCLSKADEDLLVSFFCWYVRPSRSFSSGITVTVLDDYEHMNDYLFIKRCTEIFDCYTQMHKMLPDEPEIAL